MIIELLLLFALCIALGAFAGLMPGITPLMPLLLILPLIKNFSAEILLIFWACYISVSQYYGSVSALLLKVPGETSSLPVLAASRDIVSTRNIIRSYRLTAMGSLIASLIGIAGLAIFFFWLENLWPHLFSTRITVIFLSVIFAMMLIINRQYLLNLSLITLGLLISNLPDIYSITSMCGENSWWCFSLKPTDFMLAIMCLYAVPYFFVDTNHFNARRLSRWTNLSWKPLLKFWPVAGRHGILGFLVGFVPGMGVPLSSNISATLESNANPKRRLRIMCAAESSNNASIISCMIPFLFLGIPITATEMLMDQWLVINKAMTVNAELMYSTMDLAGLKIQFSTGLLLCLSMTCIVCFFLTSRFINLYSSIQKIPASILGNLIKFLMLIFFAMTLYYAELSISSTIFTILVFSAIGIWAVKKNRDVIALPISLMIGSYAVQKFITAYQLWG